MTGFVKLVSNPLTFLILSLSFAWLFRHKHNVRNVLIITSGLWIFLIFISPFSFCIVKKWERKYPALKNNMYGQVLKNKPVHIVVLGAGYENDPDLSVTSQLSGTVARRLMEGLRCYYALENAKLVTSGAALGRGRSQAQAVADAAVALGVSPDDTLYLPNTINTENEAYSYTKRFANKYPVILATDAMHMPRAVFWFKHFGIDVIPAPCNYRFKEDPAKPVFKWKPSLNKVRMLDGLMDEWLGMLWARVKIKWD